MAVGRTSSWEMIAWWGSSIGRRPGRLTLRITARRFFTPVFSKDCPVDLEAHVRNLWLTHLAHGGRRPHLSAV